MTARPSRGVLAVAFLRIGAVAFGGLGATIALLRTDLIERRGWCADRDVSEALALTKPLPGSTVVQIVAFLGWRLGGWFGCAIAAASFPVMAGSVAWDAGLHGRRRRPCLHGRTHVSAACRNDSRYACVVCYRCLFYDLRRRGGNLARTRARDLCSVESRVALATKALNVFRASSA